MAEEMKLLGATVDRLRTTVDPDSSTRCRPVHLDDHSDHEASPHGNAGFAFGASDCPAGASTSPRLALVAHLPLSVRRASPWIFVLIPLVLGAVWAVSLTRLRLQNMTDLGLISAMPALTLLALGLLMLSFVITITRRSLNTTAAAVHVLVLVVALYGITEFVEPIPRFSAVYRHVGIINYLQIHSSANPSIDAYFDWPGFFALGDLVVKLAGWKSALAFAAWGPLLFNLLYLAPLLAIFSWATEDRRVQWLAWNAPEVVDT